MDCLSFLERYITASRPLHILFLSLCHLIDEADWATLAAMQYRGYAMLGSTLVSCELEEVCMDAHVIFSERVTVALSYQKSGPRN